jgi:hypothetical protein
MIMLATPGGNAAAPDPEPFQERAASLVSQCIDAGGAERFAVQGAPLSAPPPGIVVPTGAKVTFWRVPTDRGDLIAYSGFEGRTNFCGIVASGVDVQALGEQMNQLLAHRDGWIPDSPREDSWLQSKAQSQRYWGDHLNTSLHGAVVAVARPAGSAPVLQVHYHATGVI